MILNFQIRFTKAECQLRLPFVMYADFESVLIKQHGCTNDGKKSWTENLQHHVPCGACFYVKASDERFFRRPVIFRGETALEEFVKTL